MKSFVAERQEFLHYIENFQPKSVRVFEKNEKAVIKSGFIGKLVDKPKKKETPVIVSSSAHNNRDERNVINLYISAVF